MKRTMRILASSIFIALAPLAVAQTTTTTTTANAGQTQVATSLAANFTNLAGGTENALKLVNALRTGTSVALDTTTTTGTGTGATTTTTTTTFDVPTKPMGWGNVKIALALAQSTLLKAGITQPTPAQLQPALVAGDG